MPDIFIGNGSMAANKTNHLSFLISCSLYTIGRRQKINVIDKSHIFVYIRNWWVLGEHLRRVKRWGMSNSKIGSPVLQKSSF